MCWRRLSFFSAFDPPVLPMYPRLARADKTMPGWAGDQAAGAVCEPEVAAADLRVARRTGAGQGQESAVRRQALAAPGAGAVFAGAGRGAEGLAGAHADYGVLLLRRGFGERSAAAASGEVFGGRRAAGGVYAGVGGGAGGGPVLRVLSARRRSSWACGRCC
jgi:hypothetical protein